MLMLVMVSSPSWVKKAERAEHVFSKKHVHSARFERIPVMILFLSRFRKNLHARVGPVFRGTAIAYPIAFSTVSFP
jgi:hypothetical protein